MLDTDQLESEILQQVCNMQVEKDIREIIKLKRKLRRKWHQTRCSAHKYILNKVSKDLNRKCKRFKMKVFQNIFGPLPTTNIKNSRQTH